jgi:hypothetical protein
LERLSLGAHPHDANGLYDVDLHDVECAGMGVAQLRIDFVRKGVARPFGAIRLRNACLNDVTGNHTAVYGAIEEGTTGVESEIRDRSFSQSDKVRHGHGRKICLQPGDDEAFRGS